MCIMRLPSARLRRYSVYLLYWYKSTQFTCFTGTKVQLLTLLRALLRALAQHAAHAGVAEACWGVCSVLVEHRRAQASATGTQFTCFTGTKVQLLTLLRAFGDRVPHAHAPARSVSRIQFTCVTGTKGELLTQLRAWATEPLTRTLLHELSHAFSLLALLVQKYNY